MMTLVKGFAEVCCFPCGSSTLIALGDTMVDVIIKKISSRKIRSVMDAILKLGDILALRFNTPLILNSLINHFAGSFNKSMNAIVLASILLTTPSINVTR